MGKVQKNQVILCVIQHSQNLLDCVTRGLATFRSPIKGVLTPIYRIPNFRIRFEWQQPSEPNPSKY